MGVMKRQAAMSIVMTVATEPSSALSSLFSSSCLSPVACVSALPLKCPLDTWTLTDTLWHTPRPK